ncbi:MarR family transcriptional regulator [Paenalcaligenes niemegkensis]|uniref:MarR family winged helix-turn-helix transcriptional regulator n=1 Tax=Paenalcaligenes niemegkensis TaxID=2895469 RepID=UPI001EE8D2FA|nr:MarR family transcriptional regulator [Paenalcaligenes niemegkensis]MCQ9616999.1 MarR family transcriptional regulator [Paenalcaligenes niemegkensis]
MLNTPEWNVSPSYSNISPRNLRTQADVLSHQLVDDVAVMLVRQFSVYAEANKARMAEQSGLPLSDYKALEYIVEFKTLATGQLAQLMNLSASGVSSLINRLEAAGYIERGRHPLDRRVVAIMPIKEQCEKIIATRQNSIKGALELAAKDNPNQVMAIYDFLLDSMDSLKEGTLEWLESKNQPL